MKNLKSITLGEGNTPLIRLFNIEKLLNWQGEIWAKAECQNPTGSFKDRGSVSEVKEALKQKKMGVICASTGNMAASLAAYTAKANLKCLVVVPKNTPSGKLKQASVCGAELIEADGNYDFCVTRAKEIAEKENLLLCGDYELRRTSQRSLGNELAEAKIKFDAFITPVGNGTLGCAIIEGFVGKGKSPKFIGVQGQGSDPIYQAWKNKSEITQINNPVTIASAMKVGDPLDGKLTLDWIKKTNGQMISVSDKEIIDAQGLLAILEGTYVETSAASTLAALTVNNINTKLNVVLILTGSGLKENN
ncbi:hypothetical protein A3D76_05035 [Candidatus Roizmanbacteria bacterium RIFCSPHIGHO2_02_FULL_37_9b]|nr:MAG: hypothetical protein A3D76_05035 [Candidatus Roizmanbacteria bacterium RIFCSPHIGHO2_02_FULL_37_9b]